MFDLLLLIKIAILIVIFIYLIFSVVVLNQVRVMNKIFIEIHSSTILQVIAYINLFASISLFIIALVIL